MRLNTNTFLEQLDAKLAGRPDALDLQMVVAPYAAQLRIAESNGQEDQLKLIYGEMREALMAALEGTILPPIPSTVLGGFPAPFNAFNDFNALYPREWINPQYIKRWETRAYFGFDQLKSIDNDECPPPTPDEIEAAMTPDKITFIRTIEKPLLIMTPIGVRMSDLITAFDGKKGAMREHNPSVNHWNDRAQESTYFEHDTNDFIAYGVSEFDPVNHGGKTKRQLVDEGRAWQVLVVEGEDYVSHKNSSARIILNDNKGGYLVDLTPEDDIMMQAEGLRMGVPFESVGGGKLLTGAYIKAFNRVPSSRYSLKRARIEFGNCEPGYSDPSRGARDAIRII